jgi:hypothetical protein
MSSNHKPISYYLEIYQSGSGRDVLVSINSAGPFQAIAVGDLIDSRVWEGATTQDNILEVTRVQHIVWETDDCCSHKLMVFTKDVSNEASQCRNGAV